MDWQLLEITATLQSNYYRLSTAGKRAKYDQLQGKLFWGGDLPGSTQASTNEGTPGQTSFCSESSHPAPRASCRTGRSDKPRPGCWCTARRSPPLPAAPRAAQGTQVNSACSGALQLKRQGETRSCVRALTQASSHLYKPLGNTPGQWLWCQTGEKGNQRRKGKNHGEFASCQKRTSQDH